MTAPLRLGAVAAALSTLAALATGCGSPSSGRPPEALYAEHCQRCHGADGRGDPRARGLSPRVDLTRSRLVENEKLGAIYQRISRGYDTMPSFSHKLERGDIEALAEYVLRFRKR
jgi:mono/diheme cytochrome c family protein